MRARDLGITIGTGRPGSDNAITDVAGVRVGHATLVRGDAVRTGVTVLFPSGWSRPWTATGHGRTVSRPARPLDPNPLTE